MMATLFPRIPAILHRRSGYDLQGRPTWLPSNPTRVAIITLRGKAERSSVRADSSASRGRAEEAVADGVVLTLPGVVINTGDKLGLLGANYEVISVFPRHDLDGLLGHNQVDLRLLSGG